MPLYDFKNTKTGEVEEHMVSSSALKEFAQKNPHLQRMWNMTTFADRGVRKVGAHIDVGFKEVLNKVRTAHPLGSIRDQS